MEKDHSHYKPINAILSGTVWGIIAKIIDAIAKFITTPLLIGYFGKLDFGLITLAFSLNAYLRFMDIGMNIGTIRFYSMWLGNGEMNKVIKVSRSSMFFYGIVGLINALVFFVLAQYGSLFFNLSPIQENTFMWMMYILGVSAVFNWMGSSIGQLLSAFGEVGWINRIQAMNTLVIFAIVFVVLFFNLTLSTYFLLYSISGLLMIPMSLFRLQKQKINLRVALFPQWNRTSFSEVTKYSISIFLLGIFQVSADSLRPILLGRYATKGIGVLAEYQVIQSIAMLIIAIGGVVLQAMLPHASRLYSENNKQQMDSFVYEGTKYTSIFFCFCVFGIIVNSKAALILYMGEEYAMLSPWLILSLLTLLYMHNIPLSSLILASGKTKVLIYSAAFACLLSLSVTIALAGIYNVGGAVLGYLTFVSIQVGFNYFYYIPKILNMDSKKIFLSSFFPPLLVGIATWFLIELIKYKLHLGNGIWEVISTTLFYVTCFSILTILFVMERKDVNFLVHYFKDVVVNKVRKAN